MRTLLLADIRGVFGAKKVDRAKSEALGNECGRPSTRAD
jgi:hypothetical protein